MSKIVGALGIGMTFHFWLPDQESLNLEPENVVIRGVDVEGRAFEILVPVAILRDVLAVIDGRLVPGPLMGPRDADRLKIPDSYLAEHTDLIP